MKQTNKQTQYLRFRSTRCCFELNYVMYYTKTLLRLQLAGPRRQFYFTRPPHPPYPPYSASALRLSGRVRTALPPILSLYKYHFPARLHAHHSTTRFQQQLVPSFARYLMVGWSMPKNICRELLAHQEHMPRGVGCFWWCRLWISPWHRPCWLSHILALASRTPSTRHYPDPRNVGSANRPRYSTQV